jgi:hypothetical protein
VFITGTGFDYRIRRLYSDHPTMERMIKFRAQVAMRYAHAICACHFTYPLNPPSGQQVGS